MKRGRWRWVLLLAGGLAAVLLLTPWLSQFAYPVGAEFTDAAVTHVPNAIFLQRALLEWRQIPLWSNTILSGYPFAANPLSGLWYLPTWIAALLPQPFGVNLMVLVHLLAGGLGFFRLMRAEGVEKWPAAAGALVFLLLPRGLAHFAAGHITLVSAFAWTPWLLLAARRAVGSRLHRFQPYEGMLLAGIILADVRWAAYAGLLWAAYRFYLFLHAQSSGRKWGRFLLESGLQGLLAGLLSAPLLLPLLEYSALSTREFLQPDDNLYLSLPPVRLFGLLFPSMDGNTEWTVYAGALPLLFLTWVIALRPLRSKTGFWLAVVVICLLLSLGGVLPGYSLLARLPGFDLLRVPARFVLPVGLGMAAICAHGVQYFSENFRIAGRGAFAARLVTAGLAGFSALGALGVVLISGGNPTGFIWGAIALLCAAALLFLRERNRLNSAIWLWLVIALLVIDLFGISAQNMRFRPADSVFSEGDAAATYLASQPGIFRVYSPSYSLPQETAALDGLELASGVDPLQLRSYAKIMESGSGAAQNGYSVALPPLDGLSPAVSNQDARPDARILGLLNVRYIVAEYPLEGEGLVLEREFGQTHIYRNAYEMPRAWVQKGKQIPENSADYSAAEILEWSPNSISLRAAGPGILVLSEIVYPGWQVTVGGKKQAVLEVNSILRAVELRPGEHVARFEFHPLRMYAGLGLAGAAWAALAGWMISRRKAERDDSAA